MNFKKTVATLLSTAMVFSSLAFYSPVKAEKADVDEYFKNVKILSDWKKREASSKTMIRADIDTGDEKRSFKYDIDINTKSDVDDLKSEIELKIKEKDGNSFDMPDIKAYFNEESFFINKEAFNYFSRYMGIDKEISKDFVKIDFKSLTDGSTLDTTAHLKNISKNQAEVSEKLINFMKKIDLGIDLGFTKKAEKTYTLSWDSDKMVDVTNAYFKYIFSNFDVVEKMYKEVFDIDIYEMYKESGLEVSKEEMQKSLKMAYDMWVLEVEPHLPKVKEIIKGSSFTVEEVFEQDRYKADVSFNLVIDINKAENAFSNGEKEASAAPKSEIRLSLNSNGNSKSVQNIQITLPSSYETFDYVAYKKEQEKKFEEEMKKLQEELEEKEVKEELKLEFTISPSKKTIVMNEFGEITTKSMDLEVRNGVLYVSKADMEEILAYELETEEKYIPFKSTMEKEGFKVNWDAKTHTVMAIFEY